eukprot:TRINITY_DN19087_c0_g1_i1.p1 TRINITY_DN19087_c0_g1~~TRINITY_DN19087_c0_g1_i1.p1  ORF type:complete len:396 (+),score=88.71 TRINITY_DN19087_c0_g1_i1:66-1190(+)
MDWRPPPLTSSPPARSTAATYTPLSVQKNPPFNPPSLLEATVEKPSRLGRVQVDPVETFTKPGKSTGKKHDKIGEEDEKIGEVVGMLYAAVNGIQRRGNGKEEIQELMLRINDVVDILKGKPVKTTLNKPETKEAVTQAGMGYNRPTTTTTKTAPSSPAGTPPRRAKINHKHPILITAGCSACKTRMTKPRWEEYPTRLKREIIWAQTDLDSIAHEKKDYISSIVTENCSHCKEKKLAETVFDPVPESKRPLATEVPETIDVPVNLLQASRSNDIPTTVTVLHGFDDKDKEGNPTLEQLKQRPVWSDSSQWSSCGVTSCDVKFTMLQRKHHCRLCGYVFCDAHSRYRHTIEPLGYRRPQRVCGECNTKLVTGSN